MVAGEVVVDVAAALADVVALPMVVVDRAAAELTAAGPSDPQALRTSPTRTSPTRTIPATARHRRTMATPATQPEPNEVVTDRAAAYGFDMRRGLHLAVAFAELAAAI